MNPYSAINFTDFELSLFAEIYSEATRDSPFEGLHAVRFLQKSKLSNVALQQPLGAAEDDMVHGGVQETGPHGAG